MLAVVSTVACAWLVSGGVAYAAAPTPPTSPAPVLDRGAQARADAQERAQRQATDAVQSELAQRTARIRAGATTSSLDTQRHATSTLDRQWNDAVRDARSGRFLDAFGSREVAVIGGVVWLVYEVRVRRRRRRQHRRARGPAT